MNKPLPSLHNPFTPHGEASRARARSLFADAQAELDMAHQTAAPCPATQGHSPQNPGVYSPPHTHMLHADWSDHLMDSVQSGASALVMVAQAQLQAQNQALQARRAQYHAQKWATTPQQHEPNTSNNDVIDVQAREASPPTDTTP